MKKAEVVAVKVVKEIEGLEKKIEEIKIKTKTGEESRKNIEAKVERRNQVPAAVIAAIVAAVEAEIKAEIEKARKDKLK